MENTTRQIQRRDDSVRVAAEIVGVSESLVRKAQSGERNNDEVLDTLIEYKKAKEKVIEKLKERQDLYREAAKSGRLQEAYKLEEEIDALQAEFDTVRKDKITEFYAG